LTTLVWALAVGLIVAAAARNLPGVLEIAVLQRLPIGFGSRYAITKIAQYLIVAIGIVVIFSTIGVAWSHLQWLVAALGVGLGFGLQEIFANFMSGLIMLFERPVRIGDTVTIGDLSGTVSRMRMRATTITDWDNKEIIVPNKMFITDRLINWTLSDPITRVIIPVGIAYGSDTNLAYRVICETAEQNPIVLEEPQYQVFFLGFGESSLNFELRVFVRDLGDRLRVRHELHMAINKAFAENDIEIPFPQRDLHVRSWVGSQDFGSEAPEPSAS
jgi:potassium efflux system protein